MVLNMCRPVLAILLLSLTYLSCAQTIQRTSDGRIIVVQATRPADGDSSAKTPEQIAKVNHKLAADGNTEAAYQLGLAYMQGLGVSQNLKLAEHWFEIGATTPGQKREVADQYATGQYFQKDLQAAVHWYTAAGDSWSFF